MTRGRLVTIALVVSLTVNLLFAGALIGQVWGPKKRHFPPHFGWMIRNLDEETRDELRPVIKRQAEQLRPLGREMRRAQRRFNEALARDPIDEEALNKAITDVRETSAAYQAAMHGQAMLIIRHMDPEERQAVARYLRHRQPGDRYRTDSKRRDRNPEG